VAVPKQTENNGLAGPLACAAQPEERLGGPVGGGEGGGGRTQEVGAEGEQTLLQRGAEP